MYGWVVEVVAMVMMIRAFLFAPLFARFARAGQPPSHQLWRHMIRVCVRVCSCVRAFAPLPAWGGYERTYGCVCGGGGQAVSLDLDHHDYDDLPVGSVCCMHAWLIWFRVWGRVGWF